MNDKLKRATQELQKAAGVAMVPLEIKFHADGSGRVTFGKSSEEFGYDTTLEDVLDTILQVPKASPAALWLDKNVKRA